MPSEMSAGDFLEQTDLFRREIARLCRVDDQRADRLTVGAQRQRQRGTKTARQALVAHCAKRAIAFDVVVDRAAVACDCGGRHTASAGRAAVEAHPRP